MSNGNLFCVGDDWQAIYSFRGSNVNHFLSFAKKYEDARIFRLEQNFRSKDRIVQIANRLIGYNRNRVDKTAFNEVYTGADEMAADSMLATPQAEAQAGPAGAPQPDEDPETSE